MGIFDKFKTSTAIDRLSEEKLYEQVAQELKAGKKREGIWVKAMAKSGGDLNKAEALYIELRVQAIKDETSLTKAQRVREVKAEEDSKEKFERLRKPVLVDFGINEKDIESLDKAYSKASKNLLLWIVFLYLIWSYVIFSELDRPIWIELSVLSLPFILGGYILLILPIRYFTRLGDANYLSVVKYKKALKKYTQCN
jgi:hypothetical protein